MAGTTGTLTVRATAFLAAAKIRFPTSRYAGGFACRTIIPHDGGTSGTWSEHAWGNAIDLGGSDALMQRIMAWAERWRTRFGIYEIIGPGSAVAVVHVDFLPHHGGQVPPCAGGPPVAPKPAGAGIHRGSTPKQVMTAMYAVAQQGIAAKEAKGATLAKMVAIGQRAGWTKAAAALAAQQVYAGAMTVATDPGHRAAEAIGGAVSAVPRFLAFVTENFAPVATMAAGGALAIVALWLLAKEAGLGVPGPAQAAAGAVGGPVAAARVKAATEARAQTQRDREARSVYLAEQRSAARERGVLAAREGAARTESRRYTTAQARERAEEGPFDRGRYERNVAAQRRRKATVG